MDNREAIKWLKQLVDSEEINEFYYADRFKEALESAIQAIEELEQYKALDDKLQIECGTSIKELCEKWNVMLAEYLEYRELGTAEEITDIFALCKILQGTVKQYAEVGTLEQVREAVEKQVPKKPNYEGDGYYNGELVLDTWICPTCGKSYEVDYDSYDYCPNCGQHIDHSGLTEDD